MSALTGLTLAAARDGLRTKKFSAVELTRLMSPRWKPRGR